MTYTYPFPLPSAPYPRHAAIVEELLRRGYYDKGWKPDSFEAYRTVEAEMQQRDKEQRLLGAEAHASDLVERNRDLEAEVDRLRCLLAAAEDSERNWKANHAEAERRKRVKDDIIKETRAKMKAAEMEQHCAERARDEWIGHAQHWKAVAQCGWTQVSEKLPENSKLVIVYDGGWGAVYITSQDDGVWEQPDGREPPDRITHWRELPAAPRVEREG